MNVPEHTVPDLIPSVMRSRSHHRILPIVLGTVVLSWIGFVLVGKLIERDMDQTCIQLLRDPDNLSRIIGPPGLQEFMRDVTALGGYTVLVPVVLAFAVYLRLEGDRRDRLCFAATVVGGYFCGSLLKLLVERERPSIVPHLSHVSGATSLPSLHAMMSAVVYLSIGLWFSGRTTCRFHQRLLISVPLCLTFLIGISRVFMGVHFPTDVFAGWTAGLLWTWVFCHFVPQPIQKGPEKSGLGRCQPTGTGAAKSK